VSFVFKRIFHVPFPNRFLQFTTYYSLFPHSNLVSPRKVSMPSTINHSPLTINHSPITNY
jgi:hypothetical protein